jgi:hypothetical protein
MGRAAVLLRLLQPSMVKRVHLVVKEASACKKAGTQFCVMRPLPVAEVGGRIWGVPPSIFQRKSGERLVMEGEVVAVGKATAGLAEPCAVAVIMEVEALAVLEPLGLPLGLAEACEGVVRAVDTEEAEVNEEGVGLREGADETENKAGGSAGVCEGVRVGVMEVGQVTDKSVTLPALPALARPPAPT